MAKETVKKNDKTKEVKSAKKEVIKEEVKVETPQPDMSDMLNLIASLKAELDSLKASKEEVETETKVEGKKLTNNTLRVGRQQSTGFDLDGERKVPVISVKNSPVCYDCKLKKMTIRWSKFGEEHMMPIEEVNMMNGESHRFLQTPWLIVDDEEYAEAMGLKELYNTVFELQDIVTFFKENRQIVIESKLDSLEPSFRKDIIKRVLEAIAKEEITDVTVMRLLKNKYGIDIEI